MRATKPVSLAGAALLLALVLAAAGCGGSDEETGGAGEPSGSDVSAEVRQAAAYWAQLTELFEPVELASMTDHRAYMLPNGHLLALHFDDMDLGAAENLNWVALGVPGTFCEADQKRVEKEFGPGFIHFHDLEADTHGGEPGAEGVWFVHVGVRDFESDMSTGPVTGGEVDDGFMPTPAPSCA